MKFLVGLMLGALVTLFVATVFDVPTDSLLARGKTSWNDFLVATGDALYEFPELPVVPRETAAAPASAADAVDKPAPAAGTGGKGAVPPATDLAAEKDAQADAHPRPTALPLATRDEPRDLGALLALSEAPTRVGTPTSVEAPTGTGVEAGTSAGDDPGGHDAPGDAPGDGAGDVGLPVQAVWVPFRSQMSAQGFARRLTGQLDHPFSVNREGPGRYQVIFSYADDLERREMLDQVQTVTGEVVP